MSGSTDVLQGVLGAWQKPPPFTAPVSNITEALMVQRGLSAGDSDFLNPTLERDPFYPFFAKPAEWLAALPPGSALINADYDTDGTTTATILGKTLSTLGWNVRCFVPNRFTDTYGVNMPKIRKAFEDRPFSLLVAGDCGAASMTELNDFAIEKNIPTLVLDHHKREGAPERLSPLVQEMNPQNHLQNGLLENGYSAAVLSLMLAEHLAQQKEALKPLLTEMRVLAGLSAVADVVSMKSTAGRYCAKQFLTNVRSNQSNVGLKYLVEGDSRLSREITTSDVAFTIVPMINAPGRLAHANKALELFTCKDQLSARKIVAELKARNDERKVLQEKIHMEASARHSPDRNVLIAYDRGWHIGCVGPAAGSLAERLGVPAFIGGFNDAKNAFTFSARTVGDIDVHALLQHAARDMPDLRFGGHKAALGLTIPAEDVERVVPILAERMHANCRKNEVVKQFNLYLRAETVCHSNWQQVRQLEPYGADSQSPVFCIPHVDLKLKPSDTTPGKAEGVAVDGNGHEFNVVVFKRPEIAQQPPMHCHVIGELLPYNYRGDAEIKVNVKDIVPAVRER